jgi:hypothetical protein
MKVLVSMMAVLDFGTDAVPDDDAIAGHTRTALEGETVVDFWSGMPYAKDSTHYAAVIDELQGIEVRR